MIVDKTAAEPIIVHPIGPISDNVAVPVAVAAELEVKTTELVASEPIASATTK